MALPRDPWSNWLSGGRSVLFNSYIFIFVFLPLTLTGFHLLGRYGKQRTAMAFLVAMSLLFYGWWNPAYLTLILVSIVANFTLGYSLTRTPRRIVLFAGVAFNLGLIGYFKYANFFVDNLNDFAGTSLLLEQILLPLAISFFTFQQITYLVDAYRGETREYNFLHYCLFVTFFPQLIAGPIVHHKEMLPQFANRELYRLQASHLAVGLTIFFLGLCKKVLVADNIALYSTPVFDAAEAGTVLTFFEAWGGALAYTFQLYFDFSGYSDMAIGLARMFGVTLPINFFSPYKATSIIEFWQRWHITLSRFLRDYLYISLGGNRKGTHRRYLNLLVTMLLGGLWHGAGWTFIAWGGLHGFYLVVNHAWRNLKTRLGIDRAEGNRLFAALSCLFTFVAVVIGWVMFRAESFSGALAVYSGMFGLNGLSLPIDFAIEFRRFAEIFASSEVIYLGSFYNEVFPNPEKGYRFLLVLLVWVWFAPNTLEWLRDCNPAYYLENYLDPARGRLRWRASGVYALLMLGIAMASILAIQGESEFLYFRF